MNSAHTVKVVNGRPITQHEYKYGKCLHKETSIKIKYKKCERLIYFKLKMMIFFLKGLSIKII